MKAVKRIFVILISLTLIIALQSTYVFASNRERSWYIKRNGCLQPILDSEQEIIYQYNGYYIDKNHGDNDNEKIIYLTFDLGYKNENTDKIVETINSENVKAAFFILDNIVLKNADWVTELENNGHLICNHTKNHKNLSGASVDEITKNLTDLEKIYTEKTGRELSKYFRFPEGRYSEDALKCVNDLGYKTVFWSFAYDDWDDSRQPNPKRAIQKILNNTHNGAIMLFHPTSKTNAEIFPELIKTWRDMGYCFGTLDDLCP